LLDVWSAAVVAGRPRLSMAPDEEVGKEVVPGV
jgi:hypothetical protein